MSDHNDLRQKIDEAKRRLPLPELMAREGLGEQAKKSAHCPFHHDEHESFSVFKGDDNFWLWKCFGRFARKLADFGIHSKTLRIAEEQAKGYELADFSEVFERYLKG